MNKKQASIITLLVVGIFIVALLDAQRIWSRIDLTEGKAYTLSKVSRDLYKEIPERLTITYYLSEKLAKLHPIPGEIEDLLKEYEAHSHGKIRLIVQDPVKAGTVGAVEQLGVMPQQIQTMDKDQASVATVYTGIVLEYLNKTVTIPVAFSLDTLEYDLTSRIRSLVRDTSRDVGVIVAQADKTWSSDYSDLSQALTQAGYQVRQITAGDEIPDTLPELFVFGGAEELDDWALYRIDRYIQEGGKVLFGVNGVFVDSRSNLQARAVKDKGLLAMLSSYGVTVEPSLVLDKAALTIPYQTMGPSGGMQLQLLRYPEWVAVLQQYANKNNPITARFAGIDLYWPSPLKLNPVTNVQAETLASSTPDAWLMTKDFVASPDMAMMFTAELDKTKGQKPLVAALTGTFPSYFAHKSKPTRTGSSQTLPDLPQTPKSSRIIVVGDGNFATSLIQYTHSDRNLDFLVQAADWLGNDGDIIAIHNRAPRTGRLDAISDTAVRAQTALFAQFLNVVLIPLIVILFGIIRSLRRKAKGKEEANVIQA